MRQSSVGASFVYIKEKTNSILSIIILSSFLFLFSVVVVVVVVVLK